MELLKKIFSDDDGVVGLCAFRKNFIRPKKIYNNVRSFSATRLVYSSDSNRDVNIFAFA